ncbi:MAG TPA: ABC transporter ATP-binding protein [Anaerolineae bacterium]|nr:ABC transporter ATP-binding protein [Anaerolineae bacterium]
MQNGLAVKVRGLKKYYDEIKAVDDIDFTIRKGEIFSLLGPNGAGKTTTINMIAGLFPPDAGDALLLGYSITKEPLKAKAKLGVVPQEVALYDDLSARENLTFWGKMYGLRGSKLSKRVDAVLKVVGLTKRQKGKVGKFSGGMKRRVNVGIAFLHLPEIIIMDEPTVGIDPQSRRYILDKVLDLKNQGTTVLYTTHYMEEAQELSDHIAIMDHGKIIAYGTNEELLKLVGEQTRVDLTLSADGSKILHQWEKVKGVSRVKQQDEVVTLLMDDSNLVLPRLFETANQQHIRITSVDIQEPNLEAVFLHLTGRALRN